jgi:hypothetical protein
MNLPKQCVFNGSTENLNTCMKIRLDSGEMVDAWVSDEFADSATPSKVKQAAESLLKSAKNEVDELIAKAKALGLTILPAGVVSPKAPPPPELPGPETEAILAQPVKPKLITEVKPTTKGGRIIDGKTADAKRVDAMVSGSVTAMGANVSGGGSEYDISSVEKPTEDLKAGEIAEINTVKGRGGIDIAIPVRRVGKSGETRVTVVNTGGDAGLQQRFRDLATASQSDNPPDFIHGYAVKTINCPLCRGSGKVMGDRECPKCQGVGVLDVDQ